MRQDKQTTWALNSARNKSRPEVATTSKQLDTGAIKVTPQIDVASVPATFDTSATYVALLQYVEIPVKRGLKCGEKRKTQDRIDPLSRLSNT